MTVMRLDVKPLDPIVFGGVTLVLAFPGALARLIPSTLLQSNPRLATHMRPERTLYSRHSPLATEFRGALP